MENFYRVLGPELGDFKLCLAKWELVEIRKYSRHDGFAWWTQQSEGLEAILDSGMLVLINELLD